MRDLVRLPGLGDLVLADDQPGDVGDRPQQGHLFFPPALASLVPCRPPPPPPGRDVTGVAGDRRVSHGWPGPPGTAAGPARAARPRRVAGAAAPPAPPGRGTRGGRPGLRGRSSAAPPPARSAPPPAHRDPGDRQPVERRRRRRHPPPGHRADPAAVPGQHLRPQPAAACAIASGLRCPQATPATSTDTSDASPCRTPCGLRGPSAAPPPHPGASAEPRPGRGPPRRHPGGGRRHRPAMMKTRARLRGMIRLVSTRIVTTGRARRSSTSARATPCAAGDPPAPHQAHNETDRRARQPGPQHHRKSASAITLSHTDFDESLVSSPLPGIITT